VILKKLRATAFGFFSLSSGIAMLLASVIAGWLWTSFGASYTFYYIGEIRATH